MEHAYAYPFERGEPSARTDSTLAVFVIPLDMARAWPEELRRM